jgi:hypothetical protein
MKITNYKVASGYLFQVGFLISLLFDPEDEGDMFLRNVGCLSTGYTALYPRTEVFITTPVAASNSALLTMFIFSEE